MQIIMPCLENSSNLIEMEWVDMRNPRVGVKDFDLSGANAWKSIEMFSDADYNENKFELPTDGNFFNNAYFYINIVWYLIFCTYISMVAFSDMDFISMRDKCMEGAFYEMQMAT